MKDNKQFGLFDVLYISQERQKETPTNFYHGNSN